MNSLNQTVSAERKNIQSSKHNSTESFSQHQKPQQTRSSPNRPLIKNSKPKNNDILGGFLDLVNRASSFWSKKFHKEEEETKEDTESYVPSYSESKSHGDAYDDEFVGDSEALIEE